MSASSEKSLTQQLRLFEAISATTPDFLYAFDLQGRFLYANKRLLEVWGVTADQAIGKNLYELGYPQWHADMHMRELKHVIETRQPIKGEVPFTGGSGISGVYEYIFNPVLGSNGQVEMIIGTTRDVTDRSTLGAALKAERAKLASIIEQAPAFMAVLRGPDHVFELANERYLEIVGGRDIIGKPISQALPEIVDQGFVHLLDQVYRTGKSFHGNEVRVLLRQSGEAELQPRYFNFVYQALREPDGTISGIFVHGVDVTGQVIAGDELRESQQRWQLAVRGTNDGIWDWNLATNELYWSPRAKEMLGYGDDELRVSVDSVRELMHPDDRDAGWKEAQRHLAGQSPLFSAEYRLKHKDGSYRWVLARGVAIRDAEGKPVRMAGSQTDMTDRRELEESLRLSGARLSLAVGAVGLGLWSIDLESGRIEESDRLMAILGLPAGATHKSAEEWRKYLHPDDADRVLAKFKAALKKADDYEEELRLIGADGVTRWVHVNASVARNASGMPISVFGVAADVTRRKEDERFHAHMAAIVESSDDAIISKSLEGIIQSWNVGARRIFGYTADETVGRSILMLLPPERHHEETAILSKLRAGERIDHYESVRVTKDGRHIDVSLTISPVKDSSGRIVAASKIARDVTRQKRSERELQAAKEAAEKANREKDELLESERAARVEMERAGRMKDEFLATLSHELRTPLNAVLGWAQILARTPMPDDATEGLQIIERNARAQAQIIEDLLDMSRIVSGKIRLDVQRVELSGIVSAAVETVRATADAKGVRLHAVLDPAAGPVSGDVNRLQQVFWNLLTNAVKFTPRGGRVQVLLERVNSHLEVSVIDTGEGIDASFLPHVFDRFRQANGSTNRRHGGLGLGLAIAKQLVELHGGTVRAKSGGLGAGSTFTVSLPLIVIHPEPEPISERRHPVLGPVVLSEDMCLQIEGIKVLVVDDEPDARSLVKRFLEDCKAIVTTASSAAEGLELLKSIRPQILVSDVGMPGEDGYTLIRRVRALPPEQGGDTPAIALTAYARAEDRMKAVMAGFQQHVVKPVEPAELITLVGILAAPMRRSGASSVEMDDQKSTK